MLLFFVSCEDYLDQKYCLASWRCDHTFPLTYTHSLCPCCSPSYLSHLNLIPPSLSFSSVTYLCRGGGLVFSVCPFCLFFFKPNECGLGAFNETYGELTPQSTHTHTHVVLPSTPCPGQHPDCSSHPQHEQMHFNSSLTLPAAFRILP